MAVVSHCQWLSVDFVCMAVVSHCQWLSVGFVCMAVVSVTANRLCHYVCYLCRDCVYGCSLNDCQWTLCAVCAGTVCTAVVSMTANRLCVQELCVQLWSQWLSVDLVCYVCRNCVYGWGLSDCQWTLCVWLWCQWLPIDYVTMCAMCAGTVCMAVVSMTANNWDWLLLETRELTRVYFPPRSAKDTDHRIFVYIIQTKQHWCTEFEKKFKPNQLFECVYKVFPWSCLEWFCTCSPVHQWCRSTENKARW